MLASDGEFSLALDTGTYYFIIMPPNYLFLPCQTIQVVEVLPNGTPPVMIPLMPYDECPKMSVDVGTAFLRPCTESSYMVQYCNEGTATALGAYVEITLPSDLIMGSSAIPFTPVSNGVFSFDLGDMQPGECHDFWFNATLVCDSELGLTHCVEAHIYPDSICMDTAMFWDGSSVEVTADCQGDSIILNIANNGWGDMSEALNFIVVEDNVLIRDSNFQLASGNSTNLVIYPNGATIILQAQQSFGHPGQSMPVVFIEGCGGDSISIGFVTQYPQNDADCFVAIDCRESVNSFDPNIKEAQPKGITEAHFITPETDLDYQITFQNLGTAPALEVVILDTLSEKLDTATLRPGVSSHEYKWELIGSNILKFTFENINLPQANIDSMASIGFVKYNIAQKVGNTAGTIINNTAAIYFDQNDPVITNMVTHRIPAPELFKNENLVLCEGEIFNGETITENTIVYDTVRYAFFDSVFVFDLTVFPDLSETIDTAVLIGSEIYGTVIQSDTTLTIELSDEHGCPYTLIVQVDAVVSSLEAMVETRILISPNPIKGRSPSVGNCHQRVMSPPACSMPLAKR